MSIGGKTQTQATQEAAPKRFSFAESVAAWQTSAAQKAAASAASKSGSLLDEESDDEMDGEIVGTGTQL